MIPERGRGWQNVGIVLLSPPLILWVSTCEQTVLCYCVYLRTGDFLWVVVRATLLDLGSILVLRVVLCSACWFVILRQLWALLLQQSILDTKITTSFQNVSDSATTSHLLLCGINVGEMHPGNHVSLNPHPLGDLYCVRFSHHGSSANLKLFGPHDISWFRSIQCKSR